MEELIILAHVPTDSVNRGFLPAARELGHEVVLLSDQADVHRRHFSQPDLPAYPHAIIACDVFNPVAVIEAIAGRDARPAAIFSNSDHLQTSTALAAAYFQLPGKDWRACYRTKNKAEMRAAQTKEFHAVWSRVLREPLEQDQGMPFPCVVKPQEGVASQQVRLVRNAAELNDHCQAIWARQPDRAVLAEEYIAGPLLTLETLGDGERIRILGGFQVELSAPPHFIELAAHWLRKVPAASALLDQITALGVGFGACHSEFVLTQDGPRLIEVNYRSIGDGRDFLIQKTLGLPLFETVLRLHLGDPLPVFEVPARAATIRYFPAQRAGRLSQMPAAFNFDRAGVALDYRPLRQPGEEIVLSHSNKDYLGVLSAVGDDPERVGRAVTQATEDLAWEIRP